MFRFFSIILATILVCGCVSTTETTAEDAEPAGAAWYDSLITGYVNNSSNEQRKKAVADSIAIEWKYEGIAGTDSMQYMVFRIGHTVENRFITDDWLYIDSAGRRIFNYDRGKDSVTLWEP